VNHVHTTKGGSSLAKVKSNLSDEALYISYKQGDRQAGEKLFDSWIPRLVQFALNKGLPLSDAQDVAQTTLCSLVKTKSSFKGDSFSVWLFHIALNHIRALWNKERMKRLAERCAVAEGEIDASFVVTLRSSLFDEDEPLKISEIRRLMEIIPKKYRRLIEDRVLGQISFDEIARRNGLSDKRAAFDRLKFALKLAKSSMASVRDPGGRKVCRGLTVRDFQTHLNLLKPEERDAAIKMCSEFKTATEVAREMGVRPEVLFGRLYTAAIKIKKAKKLLQNPSL
jgi:RNA polymerase sigma factor (sigma-70 family)